MKRSISITYSKKLSIRTKDRVQFLNAEEVLFFCKRINKVAVTYIDGRGEEIAISMAKLEELLKGMPFWRSTSNYIINLKNLERISTLDNDVVTMKGDVQVPIDENRKELLVEELSKMVNCKGA